MMNCSSRSSRRIASNMLLRGGELFRNPVVEVDQGGKILAIECGVESLDREPSTEFYAGVMVAGFVNAHCHLELSYLRGAIDPYGGFLHFLQQMRAQRGLFSDEARLCAVEQGDMELYRGGVVAVGDIANDTKALCVKSRSKITYRSFAEVFGLWTEDWSHMNEVLKHPLTNLTPHSIYSLNDDLFRAIVAHDAVDSQSSKATAPPLSIHFMESPGEAELFECEGYLDEWYRGMGYECDFRHYGSPAERLVASVPSDRSLLLVHNCCLTQRDIDIVMGHFSAPIYWVVCPRSNDFISRLTPPVELLRRNGLNICVGTDSLASNWSLSMVEELRAMPSVPLVERLDWATRIGAKALQMDHLGDIEVGKTPGINILSAIDYTTMQLTPQSRITRILESV